MPSTGKSFTFPLAHQLHMTTAREQRSARAFTATFTGFIGHAPGLYADPGIVFYSGVVTGFDELGLPELDLTTESAVEGA